MTTPDEAFERATVDLELFDDEVKRLVLRLSAEAAIDLDASAQGLALQLMASRVRRELRDMRRALRMLAREIQP